MTHNPATHREAMHHPNTINVDDLEVPEQIDLATHDKIDGHWYRDLAHYQENYMNTIANYESLKQVRRCGHSAARHLAVLPHFVYV